MAYLPDFAERSLVFVGRAGVVLHNDVKALCFLSVRTSVRKKNLRVDWVDPSAQAIARVNVSDLFLTGVDLFTDRQTVPRIGKVIDKVSDSVRTKSGNKQRMIRDRS